MKKIGVLPLLMIACHLSAQSGNNNALAFPTSNNTFLGKTTAKANVGVDLYTGMGQVNIPLCKLDSRELSIPISLDYVDGRGVKVQEYASQVGLGWQINAGGSISRVVRGFPDEQPNGFLGTGTLPSGQLSAGQRWGQVAATVATGGTIPDNQFQCLMGWRFNPLTVATATADGEPDIFYVKTPFFNFQFIFDANGNAVFPNSTGYKVITTNFFNTAAPVSQNPTFEIIDDQGNQFYFGSTSQSTEQSTDSLYNVPTTFISSWYLDKIVTFNNKDVINLTYQATTFNDVTYNYSWSETVDPTLNKVTTLNTGQTIVPSPKYLSVISGSLGELDFTYTNRMDDNNALALSTIVQKAYNPQTASNSTVLQTYSFRYGYFGLPSTDQNVLRLELIGVMVAGNTTATSSPLTVASFGYNATSPPNRTWPLFDYWGYCNATTNPGGLDNSTISRLPSATTIQAGILNTVYTMEGGIWQISYEPNVYGGSLTDGVRVNQLSQTLPTGTVTKTYSYVDINNNASGQIMNAFYSQINFLFGNAQLILSGSPFIINDINGNFMAYSSVKVTEPNGGYTFHTFTNFNEQNDANSIGFNDVPVIAWSNTSNPFPLAISATDVAVKRGLPKSEDTYTAAGSHISNTTYTYTPQSTGTKTGYGARGFTLGAPGGGSNSCVTSYYTPVENYRLTKIVHTDYDQLSPTTNSITKTTNYTYDPLNTRLINQVSTTDPTGATFTRKIFHAEDIVNTAPNQIPMVTTSETTAINGMVAANKTNVIIHTTDNMNGTINQTHNAYANVPNGPVIRVYLANTATYGSDLVSTTPTLAKQQSFTFDPVFSNLLTANPPGGVNSSISYLYNTSLPVAKIANASNAFTVNEFFFQGFEETGGNVTTSAHTGNQSFTGSYTVPFSVPNSRTYILQWYSFSGGAWVFNQQPYTGTTTLTGQIDDVRVFPKDALMTTYTYNPLVGKTSETDPSGRTTIYQYDGLNRLQTVLDKDNNVLKQYDYKYQFLPFTGSSALSLTGVPGYSSGGPTTGQGLIYAPVGYPVVVTMFAAGSPGAPCGLNVQVNGVTINGPTSVTNGTASFTFIMPSTGQVGWFASLVPTGPGGGDFTIK